MLPTVDFEPRLASEPFEVKLSGSLLANVEDALAGPSRVDFEVPFPQDPWVEIHLHSEHAVLCNATALRPNVTEANQGFFLWQIPEADAALFRTCAVNGQIRVAWASTAEPPNLRHYTAPSFIDNWALRVTGFITAPETDTYFLRVQANDAFILKIGGHEVASGEVVNRYSKSPYVSWDYDRKGYTITFSQPRPLLLIHLCTV